MDIFLVRDNADQFLLPGPARMCGDDSQSREITGQTIQMNRPAVIQADPLATVAVRAQNGESSVKHHGLFTRCQLLPQGIIFPVVGIETLIRGVKLEPLD